MSYISRLCLPAIVLLPSLLAAGCMFQSISSATKLRDAIVGLNDELRWKRMDLAIQRVSPVYRTKFLQTHHAWAEDIEIGDLDVSNVELSEDSDRAISYVQVQWYRLDTMTVERTVIRQRWEKASNTFILTDESVVSGDEDLLLPPPDEEAEGEDNGDETDEEALAERDDDLDIDEDGRDFGVDEDDAWLTVARASR